MTPEKLLEAMTDLEDYDIMDAKKQNARRRGGTRKFVVLIAAVVALMAMTVTAFAAEEISGWFAKYFANNTETPLSTDQLDFIEENEQNISQSQTQDGFTLELKSAITDGKIAYVVVGITAPEGISLTEPIAENYDPSGPRILFRDIAIITSDRECCYEISSMSRVEDNDALTNTRDLLFTIEYFEERGESPFVADVEWNIHMEDLVAEYFDLAYWNQIQEERDGQDSSPLTEEESERLHHRVVWAEGNWDFSFRFEKYELRELELISEPITASSCIGWKADGTNLYDDVEITSFVLRPLGATISCANYDRAAPDFTDIDEPVLAVMKDGSRIALMANSSKIGEQQLLAVSPIAIENVDYILLADGTTIPVSAERRAEVELIDTPITLSICVGMRPEDGRDVYMDMKITSFVLRSLSASIYCEDTSFAPEIGNNFDRPIYVVMEDGQRIRLKADTGLPGEQKLIAEAPILLENVDYVLLPGGTKLPMP